MSEDNLQITFTLEKRTYQDLDSGEEVTDWQVTSDQIPRPCVGDSPAEALEVAAASFEMEDGRGALDFEELAEYPETEFAEL